MHLYGFMPLSGSIESDKHNGSIEKYEMCSYGFMVFSSIESDNHNGAIEKFAKRSDKVTRKIFLHLYGFMYLSGSIEFDNQNGSIEKFEGFG